RGRRAGRGDLRVREHAQPPERAHGRPGADARGGVAHRHVPPGVDEAEPLLQRRRHSDRPRAWRAHRRRRLRVLPRLGRDRVRRSVPDDDVSRHRRRARRRDQRDHRRLQPHARHRHSRVPDGRGDDGGAGTRPAERRRGPRVLPRHADDHPRPRAGADQAGQDARAGEGGANHRRLRSALGRARRAVVDGEVRRSRLQDAAAEAREAGSDAAAGEEEEPAMIGARGKQPRRTPRSRSQLVRGCSAFSGLAFWGVLGPPAVPARARGGRGQAPPAPPAVPRAAAPIDLTGYWVSLVTDDWRWRMVTPPKGDVLYLPVNAEGRRAAEAWDPAKDKAAGEQCRAYGAGGLMHLPGRLRISWQDDGPLVVEADAGTQTRVLHFGGEAPAGEAPSWQGYSTALWEMDGGGSGRRGRPMTVKPAHGSLKTVTTHLKPGYFRRNG